MRILDVESVAPSEAGALTEHLVEGEQVRAAFRSPSASVVFTDRRILLIQIETLLDEKVETSSFSYRAMRQFSLTEASGANGRSALKIWLGAEPQPLQLRSSGGEALPALQRLLAEMLA